MHLEGMIETYRDSLFVLLVKEGNPLQASRKFRRGLLLLRHLDHAFGDEKNEAGAEKGKLL